MFDWIKPKARAASRPAGVLAELLAGYPACTPPHSGQNGAAAWSGLPILTLEQCRDNLNHYRDAVPERLALLRGVLSGLGVDIAQAYVDPAAFVAAIHSTLLHELPPLHRPHLGNRANREMSTRAGPDIVLSLMADLAMLEGDILMRAHPGCFLGLNLDPADRKMLSWRRPCLLGLVDRLFPQGGDIFHLEAEWFGIYANMDNPGRLAAPDRVMPETWGIVIGGTILQRLDRNFVDPALTEKLRSTWLGAAS